MTNNRNKDKNQNQDQGTNEEVSTPFDTQYHTDQPGSQPDTVNEQVQGGFVPGAENNLPDVRYINPDAGQKGAPAAVASQSPLEQFVNLLEDPTVKRAFETFVSGIVSRKIGEAVTLNQLAEQAVEEERARAQEPDFLAKFAHTEYPNIEIREYVMVDGEPDRTQETGFDIAFRQGIFLAKTENQYQFLRWKMEHDARAGALYDRRSQIIGGDRQIRLVEDRTQQSS